MNKILFAVLVSAISFGGIQGSYATKNPTEENKLVKSLRKLSLVPPIDKNKENRTPNKERWELCAPFKNGIIPSSVKKRIQKYPNRYKIENGMLWKNNGIN